MISRGVSSVISLRGGLCGGVRFTETRMAGSLVTNPIPSDSFHIIFTSSPKRKEDALKADGSKVACTKSGAWCYSAAAVYGHGWSHQMSSEVVPPVFPRSQRKAADFKPRTQQKTWECSCASDLNDLWENTFYPNELGACSSRLLHFSLSYSPDHQLKTFNFLMKLKCHPRHPGPPKSPH